MSNMNGLRSNLLVVTLLSAVAFSSNGIAETISVSPFDSYKDLVGEYAPRYAVHAAGALGGFCGVIQGYRASGVSSAITHGAIGAAALSITTSVVQDRWSQICDFAKKTDEETGGYVSYAIETAVANPVMTVLSVVLATSLTANALNFGKSYFSAQRLASRAAIDAAMALQKNAQAQASLAAALTPEVSARLTALVNELPEINKATAALTAATAAGVAALASLTAAVVPPAAAPASV